MTLRQTIFRGCLLFLVAFSLSAAALAQEPSLLDQARREAAAGRSDRAMELYRQLVEAEPNNSAALGQLADALESSGRWREAIPYLSRLVALEPANAPRLYQLGRMKSWETGQRGEALALLKRAAELAPEKPDYRFAYAEILSWSADSRAEAAQILRALVASHPEHAPARRLLARILAGSGPAGREEAFAVLKPLLARPNPEAEDLIALAQMEESAGKMSAAADAYRKALARNPENLTAIARLAEILSWTEATRPEAVKLFERGLSLDPDNESLLLAYAEMLSWSRDSRPLARKYFEHALAQNPSNPRAMAGEAQLLAWSGRSQEALALYEKLLAADPANVVALRGKAEILNWKGRYTEARDLLTRAREIAPEDPGTLVELARSNAGLRRYTEAHDYLARVQGVGGPEFDALQREINRGLGTYMELGFAVRRNRQRLDFYRAEALVSTPFGAAHRLSARFRPTLFQTEQRDFNSNSYALALDSQVTENLAMHTEIAGETYPGAPPQVDGTLGMRYRMRPSFLLDLGFERRAVDETLLSTRGLDVSPAGGAGSLFLGQVRSNLASIGGSYSNARHRFDVSATYTDGIYAGRNLDSNRRWAVDINLGKSLRGDRPYVRVAYGFTYMSFDFDADFQPGTAPPEITGGYFSPTQFFLNYGSVYVSHRFGRELEWDSGGTMGVQNVETTTSPLSDSQFASTFSTHLIWHLNDANDLRIGYDFLNVFAAFRRNVVRITWRHYF